MTGGKYRSNIVDDFLSNFTSGSTIRGYRCHLKQFFNLINQDPDKYIVDVRRLTNDDRIDALESYEEDITKYWQWLISENRSPKTIQNAVDCIRVFLKQYRIQLDDIFWENIRRRGTGNKPVTQETPITKEMLKKILIHGDAKAKAIILVISSSGMRIGEAINLKIRNIDLNSTPTKITIRYTGPNSVKNKSSRITFISNEATVALKEWLRIRDESLATSTKRSNLPGRPKQANDERIFFCSTQNVRKIWNRLLEKAGLDQKDERMGRHKVIVHGLRKYFRTNFSRHNSDIAELLMGHEGYLSSAYLRFTEEELKQEYLKGSNHLLVFETAVDAVELKTLQSELEETKNQLIESNKRIDLINSGLLKDPDLRDEIEKMIADTLVKLQCKSTSI
jgi:integrase